MNKKLLIISPYFPPSNAPDMQRVRMSLPYFAQFGWDAEVVTVDERYSDIAKDNLLTNTVPANIPIHKVKAFDKKWTSKVGLGSIALRSLWFFRKKVDQLLSTGNYQLIYFSTTQFPVCILGDHWKKKYGISYVIDMQDPWHSEYYQNKSKAERPPKYWFSYRLNKYLEPIAMKNAGGLISVSPAYIDDLKDRYAGLATIPVAVIPFGVFAPDMQIAATHKDGFPKLLSADHIDMVYIGRGGSDMHQALLPLFRALSKMADRSKALKLYYIGTSYAPSGLGRPTIKPLAAEHGLADMVIELTDRISYYHALATLQQADALFIPGSDDPKYSASKIYPYLLADKPVLAISNSKSPGYQVLEEYELTHSFSYDATPDLEKQITAFVDQLLDGSIPEPKYKADTIAKYSARNMAQLQCGLFDEVLKTAVK